MSMQTCVWCDKLWDSDYVMFEYCSVCGDPWCHNCVEKNWIEESDTCPKCTPMIRKILSGDYTKNKKGRKK